MPPLILTPPERHFHMISLMSAAAFRRHAGYFRSADIYAAITPHYAAERH
jgi:hypothetical protein